MSNEELKPCPIRTGGNTMTHDNAPETIWAWLSNPHQRKRYSKWLAALEKPVLINAREYTRTDTIPALIAKARAEALEEAADVDMIEQAINDCMADGCIIRDSAEYVAVNIRALIQENTK